MTRSGIRTAVVAEFGRAAQFAEVAFIRNRGEAGGNSWEQLDEAIAVVNPIVVPLVEGDNPFLRVRLRRLVRPTSQPPGSGAVCRRLRRSGTACRPSGFRRRRFPTRRARNDPSQFARRCPPDSTLWLPVPLCSENPVRRDARIRPPSTSGGTLRRGEEDQYTPTPGNDHDTIFTIPGAGNRHE